MIIYITENLPALEQSEGNRRLRTIAKETLSSSSSSSDTDEHINDIVLERVQKENHSFVILLDGQRQTATEQQCRFKIDQVIKALHIQQTTSSSSSHQDSHEPPVVVVQQEEPSLQEPPLSELDILEEDGNNNNNNNNNNNLDDESFDWLEGVDLGIIEQQMNESDDIMMPWDDDDLNLEPLFPIGEEELMIDRANDILEMDLEDLEDAFFEEALPNGSDFMPLLDDDN